MKTSSIIIAGLGVTLGLGAFSGVIGHPAGAGNVSVAKADYPPGGTIGPQVRPTTAKQYLQIQVRTRLAAQSFASRNRSRKIHNPGGVGCRKISPRKAYWKTPHQCGVHTKGRVKFYTARQGKNGKLKSLR